MTEVLLARRNYVIRERSSRKSHATFSFKQKSEISGNGLLGSNQLSLNLIWRNLTALSVTLAIM